ncbi:MAG: hypothetical protein NTV94_14105 [Planctomycetota bacterium]|nr:hypothetical protein [Planctomycetota bacterium]
MQIFNGGRPGSFRIIARPAGDGVMPIEDDAEHAELPPSRGGISIAGTRDPVTPPAAPSDQARMASPRFRNLDRDD